jgi:hypothetical protein
MISQWSTPIATAIPVPSSSPEPLSVVLQKQNLDINERIRQVCGNIMHAGPTRILSDTSAVIEQLPNLLLLLKEASSPQVWLTEESAKLLVELFGLKSPKSLSRLLLQGTATFVFPLSSLPASIDWTSPDFSFFKHLSYSQRKSLMDLHAKTMQLDAIDYFFFVLGALPITSSTSSWSTGWTSSTTTSAAWYDSTRKGSVYDQIISELLDLFLGTENRGNIPPMLLHKAELTFAVLSDLVLDLNLYSFNNTTIDFSHIFELIKMVFEKIISSGTLDKNNSFLQTTTVGVFVNGTGKLLRDLLDTTNFHSVKFMHRITCQQFHELSKLYRAFCLPWDQREIARSSKDSWTRRYSDVYKAYPAALTVPRIVDFVHEYRSHPDHQRFAIAKETKVMIEGITELLSIASPGTGLVDRIPSAFAEAPIKPLWDVCKGCTWINGRVPKELGDASWRMDSMVNAAKLAIADGQHEDIYSVFTWESQPLEKQISESTDEDVPKSLKTNWLRDKPESVSTPLPHHLVSRLVLWDQPVCSNEIGIVVVILKKIISNILGVDLRRNPEQYAWVRSFSSVTVLIVAAFLAWVGTSILICPRMESSVSVAAVQFIFMIIVGLLSMKWIASQYIV